MNGDMKPMNMKMGLQKMDANSVMYPEVPEEERKATMQHLKDMMNPPKKVKPKKEDHSASDMPLKLSDSKADEHAGHDMGNKMKILRYSFQILKQMNMLVIIWLICRNKDLLP